MEVTQLLVAVVVGLGAAVQALTGFGFGLVASPFLVAALGPVQGIATSVVLASVLNAGILIPKVRLARPSLIWIIFVFSAVAAFLTARFVTLTASPAVSVGAGMVTIVAAALLWIRTGKDDPGMDGGRSSQAIAGTLGGIMNSVAGVGGPPVVLYATAARWPRQITVPTLQLYFLATNAFTLVGLNRMPSIPLSAIGAMAIGLMSGSLLGGRMSDAAIRKATLVLAAIGGVAAVVQGVRAFTD